MRTIDKLILVGIILVMVGAVVNLIRDDFKLGLDLDGGAHLVYEADFSQLPEDQDKGDAIEGVIKVIEKRVNTFGVSEPLIEKMSDDRILVQLPGIDDIEAAKNLIGATALVRFKVFEAAPDNDGDFDFVLDEDGLPVLTQLEQPTGRYQSQPATGDIDGETLELTSQLFKGNVEFRLSGEFNQPIVLFDWDDEGTDLFGEITTALSQKPDGSVERRLGIFLGDDYISSPNVIGPITGGSGQITGMSKNEARDLVDLLNAGRIPVPLTTVEEHDVSPTLGDDFVDWSIKAGVVGGALLVLFLILYYRLPGFMAGLALLVYAAVVMAAYQLIEVVLTLAGLAGFILSIGMAVDANVLIFERMKEEIRNGRTTRAAVEVGFNRAWPAIRDSNISTFLTCGILYWMGDYLTVPTVKGFAVTLFIGVAISMLSAIVVTRTFLRFMGNAHLIDKSPIFIPAKRPMTNSGEGR